MDTISKEYLSQCFHIFLNRSQASEIGAWLYTGEDITFLKILVRI